MKSETEDLDLNKQSSGIKNINTLDEKGLK
jgi:hypothetical protein